MRVARLLSNISRVLDLESIRIEPDRRTLLDDRDELGTGLSQEPEFDGSRQVHRSPIKLSRHLEGNHHWPLLHCFWLSTSLSTC